MRRFLPLFAVAGLLTALPSRGDDAPKPVKLFNGKDLKGWRTWFKGGMKADDTFSVKEGMLHCEGTPFGYIITEKEFGNYKLTLEWKWGEGAKKMKGVPNSGVLLHVTGEDAIWPKCIEAQLMSGNAGDFWMMGGSKIEADEARVDKKRPQHVFKMKTDKPAEKALGQWNRYEIICKGDTITLLVNGVKLNEGKKASMSKGRIALQSEGAPVFFRDIVLTPLE
jgi:hypothetical protein